MRRLWTAVWVACATLLAAPSARALEDYADEIARELDLDHKPACPYCHTRGQDGVATDTLFGDALKVRGFTRRRGLPSLRVALGRLEADAADSDADGVADVDELTAYADPNDPSDAGVPPTSCSVVRVRSGSGAVTQPAALFCGGVLLSLWMRRRARRRPRVLLLLLVSVLFASACAGARPWEREDLSRRGMQVEPDPQAASLDQHVYDYREGASGGYGTHAGSGCGCN